MNPLLIGMQMFYGAMALTGATIGALTGDGIKSQYDKAHFKRHRLYPHQPPKLDRLLKQIENAAADKMYECF